MEAAEKDEVIAVASDHGGYALKRILAAMLSEKGYQVLDLGTDSPESVDYPDYAQAMADAIESGRARRGVLLCGTGIGVGIAANRNPAIRAAVCHDVATARLSRQHNDANVLAMGGRVLDAETAGACLQAFLETPFQNGGRHQRRVAKLGLVASHSNL
ncbi:MAG: ribose 5-phosphate isomerase B [Alphaproteobacteria bacterium]|jgi:ribose 5-phosphate isomerase B|nr:ribose 5-phosphate isomerase B [Alphaproteobacteria bacterium]